MVAKKPSKHTKRVKDLPAKSLRAREAKGVRGGIGVEETVIVNESLKRG